MERRRWLGAAIWLMCGGIACAVSRAVAAPVHKISAEQMQRLVAQRFPLRYPVGDLFELEVEAPQLRLQPELNRIDSEMVLAVTGPALRRTYRGSFDVDFALRYEASDLSIRAHELRAHSFRIPGVAPPTLKLLDAYAQALAEQALLEVVLHRLRQRDLELADAMGLQPGDITVTPEGLTIGFVPKKR
jgi:hypothetical protein